MALKLYNTLTHQKETFKPIKKNQVSFYYCGPTVYWRQHIGGLRGNFCADIITRTLKYLDYNVKYISNYTDVGHLTGDNLGDADTGQDRMEKAAQKENISPQKIAEKYIEFYEKDSQELNILPPEKRCRATEFIPEMIEMIEILLTKNYAYKTELAIYFDVSKAENYSQLSGQNPEDKLQNAGKGEISDKNKKNPSDFAIWFFKTGQHENALQTWDSPWGQGFPGWHIECSVMSKKYLGDTIDIHMGGIEHISIHHTNEIAQSEAANDAKFVNYWLHNEHLVIDNKKMSKSLNNVVNVDDIIKKEFNPLALRFLFLQAHYRSKQNFTWNALEAAQSGYKNILLQISKLGGKVGEVNKKFKDNFMKKISDNFNTPQALVVVQNLLKSNLNKKDKLATILDFDKVLGLNLDKKNKDKKTEISQEIKELIQEREQARKDKDFKKADELRKQIEEKGFQVEDTDKGSEIRSIS